MPALFDIDRAAVERAFLARVAKLHPDLVGDDDELAVQAAALNRAKKTLLDDERRADALLTLLGGPGKEEDKSLPPGFLMEIMETREAIEAAVASGDAAERARWRQWAQHQRGTYRETVATLFAQGTHAATRGAIRTQLNAWRYIERLIEQVDPRYDPSRADFD
jgi:DnaJ-domain-containing protein 1